MAKNSGKNKINDKVLNDVTYQIMKVLFEVTREKVEKEEYLPPFPSNNWSFRGERVVVFDASNMKQGQIPKNDLIYLLKMYQRDDIAVITKGVVDAKILKLFDFWVFLSQALGTKVHQKFVKLDMPTPKAQQGPKHKRGRGRPKKVLKTDDSNSDDIETMASYHESGVQYKLTGIEYAEFLKLQLEYHDNVSKGVASPNGSMVTIQVFEEGNKEAVSVQIDLSKSTLYMKDLLLEEVYPTWDRMIQENIKVPTVPFKEYCFMENIPKSGRPNLMGFVYLTLGGGSPFHLDAGGQMDSGHICLTGYNHVIILRRLTEDALRECMSGLTECEVQQNNSYLKDVIWPSNDQFETFGINGYLPIRLILKPGEHLHISAARMHCFRKATNGQLKNTDCHYELHKDLLEELKVKYDGTVIPTEEFICLSYTWDFAYTGYTRGGIQNNATIMHTMAKLWKNYVGNTSAISLMSILHTAFNHAVNINIWDPKINPSPLEKRSTVILLALSPMVQQIKKEIAEELDFVTGLGNIDSKDPFSYDIAKRQDETPFDHGISFCNVCKGELINMYFLCQGCETEHTSNFIVGRCCFKITTATVCDGAKLHMPEKESHQTFKVKFRLFRSLDVDNGDKALTMFQEIEKATDFVVARRSAALKHSLVPRNDTNEASISATNLNSPTCAVAATRTSTNESKDGNELTAERRDTPIDSVRDGEASVIDSVNTDTDMDSPPLANQAGKPPASAATRCVVASPPFSNVPAPNDDYVKSLEAAEAFRNRECHCHCGRDDIFYSADLGGLRQHLPGDRFRVICELRRQDPCKAYIAFVEEALAYLPDWTRPNHATK